METVMWAGIARAIQITSNAANVSTLAQMSDASALVRLPGMTNLDLLVLELGTVLALLITVWILGLEHGRALASRRDR